MHLPADQQHGYGICAHLKDDTKVEDTDGTNQRDATSVEVPQGRSNQGANHRTEAEDGDDHGGLAGSQVGLAVAVFVPCRELVAERVHGQDAVDGPRDFPSPSQRVDPSQRDVRFGKLPASPCVISKQETTRGDEDAYHDGGRGGAGDVVWLAPAHGDGHGGRTGAVKPGGGGLRRGRVAVVSEQRRRQAKGSGSDRSMGKSPRGVVVDHLRHGGQSSGSAQREEAKARRRQVVVKEVDWPGWAGRVHLTWDKKKANGMGWGAASSAT